MPETEEAECLKRDSGGEAAEKAVFENPLRVK
jgi:hypothetical protein